MSDSRLALLTQWEVTIFLGGLAAIIAFRLLTGGINTRYLLYGKTKTGSRYFSPERVQLLLFTLGTAMFYLLQVINSLKTATKGVPQPLPDISNETLALLGGSHMLYLGGKAYAMLLKTIPKGE